VVGGGNAGLCAAITAQEAGAQVTLLELSDQLDRGGNSKHTRNFRVMHKAPTTTLPGSYTAQEYYDDLVKVTQGNMDHELTKLMVEQSAELLPWLEDKGIIFQPSLAGTLNLSRTNAFFLGGGKALVNAQYLHAENIGVDIYYHAKITELNIEDGKFTQATVIQQGFEYTLRADAIIFASGGFQANPEWLKEVWGAAADNFIIRGTCHNQGIVLKSLLAQDVARVATPEQCHAVAVDARSPKYDGGIVTRIDCISYSIVVNNLGVRFYDEGEDFWPKRYAIWGRLVAQQPDQIAYSIIDSKVTQQFMPPVFPSIKADSIAELAALISVDPTTLQDTVTQFNTSLTAQVPENSCVNNANGNNTAYSSTLPPQYNTDILDQCSTDGITPKKSHWALAINTPPFYAYPLKPGITFTYLGVKVNANAQVMMSNGQVSENMYASGEIMAGNILGQGYCAGTGMAIGAVFGRIAGEHAACQFK